MMDVVVDDDVVDIVFATSGLGCEGCDAELLRRVTEAGRKAIKAVVCLLPGRYAEHEVLVIPGSGVVRFMVIGASGSLIQTRRRRSPEQDRAICKMLGVRIGAVVPRRVDYELAIDC